jgi:hypothetical protein
MVSGYTRILIAIVANQAVLGPVAFIVEMRDEPKVQDVIKFITNNCRSFPAISAYG